jgi:hypothetical protein
VGWPQAFILVVVLLGIAVLRLIVLWVRLQVALDALEAQWRQTAACWEEVAHTHTDIPSQAYFAALAGDRTTCAEQLAKVRAG